MLFLWAHTHTHRRTCMHRGAHTRTQKTPFPIPFSMFDAFVQIAQILRPNWKVLSHISLYFILFSTFQWGWSIFYYFYLLAFLLDAHCIDVWLRNTKSFLKFTLHILWLLKRFPCKTANFINYFDLVCILPCWPKASNWAINLAIALHCTAIIETQNPWRQTKCSLSLSQDVKWSRAGEMMRFIL